MDNWEEFLNSDLTEENIALMNENWYMPGLEIVKGEQNVYIKIDGNIVGVVSGSGKMNDVEVSLERYIAKSTEGYKPDVPPYSYTETEIDEILVSAKEQFGEDCSVNFHDGYYVIEDGSETGLVIEHTKNNQVGVEKFKSDVRIATSENGEIGELTAASEIDERNAPIVEKYLSKILDGSEVQVVLNKDGVYEIIVDGVNLGKLEDKATIGDAVSFVQKSLKNEKGLSTIGDNRVNETNYLRAQTGQNYQVHINRELFEEIKEINRVSAIDMEDCKTLYRTDMLTDELAEAYRELVEIEENIDPDKQFDKTTELLQNLTLNIDYSLQAYDNIDRQLGVVFNSVVQDIFNINAYCKNPEINEYGTLTFKEREEKVKKVLEEYEDTLEELKNELNKDYPASGYDRYAQNIPERQYAVMCTVMQCFLPTDPAYPKDGVGSCSITDLNRFIEFSKEHDLFTKMDNYLVKGQSWDESGMSDLNDVLIHKMSSSHAASDEGFTIDGAMYGFKEDVGHTRQLEQLGIEKLTDANGQAVYRLAASELPSSVFNKDNVHYEYHDGFYYFHDDYDFDLYMFDRSAGNVCEKAFLNSFCFYSGQTTSNPNFNYFDSDSSSTRNLLDPKFLYENGISLYNQDDENKKVAIKSVMSEWYQEDISYTKRGYDEAENYSIGDYVERRIDDYNSVVSDISLVNESVYQFKQYQKLLPYEIDAEDTDYFEFLVKDYSHYCGDDVLTSDKIRFLSQEEIALYEYFKAKNPKKAAGYIDALQDAINQRDGYQQAALRIDEVNRNGGDVIDLLTMGKYGLSDGIESFGVGLGDFFVGLDSCLGIGLLGDSNFGEVRSSSDYRNMYMVSLLMEDNRYNDQLSGFMRKTLMYDYQANSSIGNQLIPTLVSFLPCGQVLSPMLLGMSAAGNSIKEAKLSGASNINSLIYGLASGGSEILMERLLGGITGLNGETAALKGWRALMHSMTEEAREEFLQTYLEGGLKSILLGEPFDISELTGEALVAGLMAMYSAGVMNLSTNCAIKIADDIVYWNSKDFNNFGEFRQFCENKIKDRKALVDISPEVAQRMGITLKQGESLKYNPNTKTYQKVKNNGLYRMTIPDSMIKSDVEIDAIKAKHSMDTNRNEAVTNLKEKVTEGTGEKAKYAAPSSGKTNDVFNDLKTHLNGTYGVSQDGILGLKIYIDENGYAYTYQDAQAIRGAEIKDGKPLTHFKERTSNAYRELCNHIETKYNLSHDETVVFLSSVDDTGACTYASVANDIFTSYLGQEDAFEKNFGFSMYDNSTGRPNFEMLLADMYFNVNSSANGGSLIMSFSDGDNLLDLSNLHQTETDPLGRPLLDTKNQKYLSNKYGKNVDSINTYLDQRGAHYDSTIVYGVNDSGANVDFDALSQKMTTDFKNGDCYSLSIYSNTGGEIRMLPTESGNQTITTSTWNEGGGHNVFVTGVNNQGFIVSSWGREYVIPFSDLKSSNAKWILTKNRVEINRGGKRGK